MAKWETAALISRTRVGRRRHLDGLKMIDLMVARRSHVSVAGPRHSAHHRSPTNAATRTNGLQAVLVVANRAIVSVAIDGGGFGVRDRVQAFLLVGRSIGMGGQARCQGQDTKTRDYGFHGSHPLGDRVRW